MILDAYTDRSSHHKIDTVISFEFVHVYFGAWLIAKLLAQLIIHAFFPSGKSRLAVS